MNNANNRMSLTEHDIKRIFIDHPMKNKKEIKPTPMFTLLFVLAMPTGIITLLISFIGGIISFFQWLF